MQITIHIKSTFNCVLSSSNEKFTLNAQETKTFFSNPDEDFLILNFYPTESDGLPFTVTVDLKTKTDTQKLGNVDVISLDDSQILLLVRPFVVFEPEPFNVKTKTLNFGNASHTLQYHTNDFFAVRFESGEKKIDLKFNQKIFDVSHKLCGEKILLYAKTAGDTYVLAVVKFDGKEYKKLVLEEVDKLYATRDSIKTYKDARDLLRHGHTTTYVLSPEFHLQKDLVYSTEEIPTITDENLIPFAFFDAVSYQNYDLAREYLCDDIKKDLDDKHFKDFFGDFIYVTHSFSAVPPSEEILLVYESVDKKFARRVNLKISNGKICDIKL